jgi:hypothetical protein
MICLLFSAVSLVQSNGLGVVESDAIVPGMKGLRNDFRHLQNNMNDAKANTPPPPPPELRRRLINTNQKWVPDKGDTTDCQSIIDRWKEHLEGNQNSTRLPPCRNGTIVDEPEPPYTSLVPGSDNGPENVPPDDEVAELIEGRNAVSVGLAVALSPGGRSHRLIVTRVVTTTLDEAVNDIDFFLSQRRQLFEHDGKGEGNEHRPDGTLQEEEAPLNEVARLPQFAPQVASPEEEGFELKGTTALYDLYYQSTRVRDGSRNDQRWYYRYDFVYLCFWKGSRFPITNQTLLQSITDDLNATLEQLISQGIIRSRIMDAAQQAVLNVSLFEEAVSDGDDVEQPTAPPPSIFANGTDDVQTERGPTYPNQLDAQGWDYRRWLGLGLFCGTVAATLLLTQVASYRKRRRTAKDVWGNLGTEEGVDELLRTGWKVNGSNMEVYDKEKLGYTDDDSILMGGFEQKHEVVGAEITVTRSTTTPDTGNRS